MPRLLIVDDNRSLCESLRKSIASDWSVEVATSAAEGRHALQVQGPWDAVLMDVELGDGNGLDLIEWGRPRHPETWWMVMTSVGDRETVIRVAELGAAFVPKPFRSQMLEQWLKSVLSRSSHVLSDFVMGAEDAEELAMHAALDRFCDLYELKDMEKCVLRLALGGVARPQIAESLKITLNTYQKYATGIKKKSGTGVPQAAVRILRWSLYGPEV